MEKVEIVKNILMVLAFLTLCVWCFLIYFFKLIRVCYKLSCQLVVEKTGLFRRQAGQSEIIQTASSPSRDNILTMRPLDPGPQDLRNSIVLRKPRSRSSGDSEWSWHQKHAPPSVYSTDIATDWESTHEETIQDGHMSRREYESSKKLEMIFHLMKTKNLLEESQNNLYHYSSTKIRNLQEQLQETTAENENLQYEITKCNHIISLLENQLDRKSYQQDKNTDQPSEANQPTLSGDECKADCESQSVLEKQNVADGDNYGKLFNTMPTHESKVDLLTHDEPISSNTSKFPHVSLTSNTNENSVNVLKRSIETPKNCNSNTLKSVKIFGNPNELKSFKISRNGNPNELKSFGTSRKVNPNELKSFAISRNGNPNELKSFRISRKGNQNELKSFGISRNDNTNEPKSFEISRKDNPNELKPFEISRNGNTNELKYFGISQNDHLDALKSVEKSKNNLSSGNVNFASLNNKSDSFILNKQTPKRLQTHKLVGELKDQPKRRRWTNSPAANSRKRSLETEGQIDSKSAPSFNSSYNLQGTLQNNFEVERSWDDASAPNHQRFIKTTSSAPDESTTPSSDGECFIKYLFFNCKNIWAQGRSGWGV